MSNLDDLKKDFEKKKPKQQYRSGLQERKTDRRQVAKATGKKSTVAGQYLRRSFPFRPDQLESVVEIADELGLSQNDVMRWFCDMGIEAVNNGAKPPVAKVVRRKYDPGR